MFHAAKRAFETALYNAYLGSVNTEQVIEPTVAKQFADCTLEPLPFDSYSPLTAGTRGNGVGGLKVMSDKHYYGCCACIGAMGLGLVPKIMALPTQKGVAVNLYIRGMFQAVTGLGTHVKFVMDTDYPVSGKVKLRVETARAEAFELSLRIPDWSKRTSISVNGESVPVEVGYTRLQRTWENGDVIELELDMRTQCLRPIPYGSQVLMNKVVWGANCVIPNYDEEDPNAKNHLALRRGPIILAQENRLGYSVDEPVDILVREDGYVDAAVTQNEIAPYVHMLECEIPLADGSCMHVTDYASAGKLWTQESKMAAWMLVKV